MIEAIVAEGDQHAMPLNHDAVGATSTPSTNSWSSKDAILYALGVGAGGDELSFVTENSRGVEQQVLPTMGVVLGNLGTDIWDALGDIDWPRLVHGAQSITLHRPLPVEGTISSVGRVANIFDKGKAALVEVETTSTDASDGSPLFTTVGSLFLRGQGGWGGDRGPSSAGDPFPDRAPDHVVAYQTAPDQALLYRLSGDRNPLHSDPEFAKDAGFDRPILHGLCTYGFTGRALLHSLCDGDPTRFRSMEGRFSAPVWPGDELTVSIWRTGGGEAVFQTRRDADTVVLDGGRCTFG